MSLDFAARTIDAIGQAAVRDDEPVAVPLDETGWCLARLTDAGLARLLTFLVDLSIRAPLAGPAWAPMAMVVTGLAEDIRRELDRRAA